MTILGIDPGYATVGYGVLETNGRQMISRGYGIISTEAGKTLEIRLKEIYEDMLVLIDTYHPDCMSVEELFFNTNITTGIAVGHARGVILLAGAMRAVPIYEYTPLQVKQAVVGYGRAEKKQVMEMTRIMLGFDKMPRPDDAADALALAICHAHSSSSSLFAKQ